MLYMKPEIPALCGRVVFTFVEIHDDDDDHLEAIVTHG
jgi:hypothetical protein